MPFGERVGSGEHVINVRVLSVTWLDDDQAGPEVEVEQEKARGRFRYRMGPEHDGPEGGTTPVPSPGDELQFVIWPWKDAGSDQLVETGQPGKPCPHCGGRGSI